MNLRFFFSRSLSWWGKKCRKKYVHNNQYYVIELCRKWWIKTGRISFRHVRKKMASKKMSTSDLSRKKSLLEYSSTVDDVFRLIRFSPLNFHEQHHNCDLFVFSFSLCLVWMLTPNEIVYLFVVYLNQVNLMLIFLNNFWNFFYCCCCDFPLYMRSKCEKKTAFMWMVECNRANKVTANFRFIKAATTTAAAKTNPSINLANSISCVCAFFFNYHDII